ncbi:hypothetical protein ACIRP7_28850 [Streptomyces sp. NPDC102270]|uniref:hypothetical protein n=1 Tax=Streptomyces sp. NPDC102270 TaxID=3366150 RepID=UPI0037FACD79
MCIGTGLAVAAGQNVLATVGTAPRPDSLAVTPALGLLAATAISIGHYLRRH